MLGTIAISAARRGVRIDKCRAVRGVPFALRLRGFYDNIRRFDFIFEELTPSI